MTADLCREGAGGQILIFTEDIRVEECMEDEAESSCATFALHVICQMQQL